LTTKVLNNTKQIKVPILIRNIKAKYCVLLFIIYGNILGINIRNFKDKYNTSLFVELS